MEYESITIPALVERAKTLNPVVYQGKRKSRDSGDIFMIDPDQLGGIESCLQKYVPFRPKPPVSNPRSPGNMSLRAVKGMNFGADHYIDEYLVEPVHTLLPESDKVEISEIYTSNGAYDSGETSGSNSDNDSCRRSDSKSPHSSPEFRNRKTSDASDCTSSASEVDPNEHDVHNYISSKSRNRPEMRTVFLSNSSDEQISSSSKCSYGHGMTKTKSFISLGNLGGCDSQNVSDTVLVIENTTVCRKMLCRSLIELDYTFEVSANSTNACSLAAKYPRKYCAILMNLLTHEKTDPRSVVDFLKSNTHDLPIILVTSDTNFIKRCGYGADEVLHKPVHKDTLLSTLTNLKVGVDIIKWKDGSESLVRMPSSSDMYTLGLCQSVKYI